MEQEDQDNILFMYDHKGSKEGYSNLWINYNKFKYLLNAASYSKELKLNTKNDSIPINIQNQGISISNTRRKNSSHLDQESNEYQTRQKNVYQSILNNQIGQVNRDNPLNPNYRQMLSR